MPVGKGGGGFEDVVGWKCEDEEKEAGLCVYMCVRCESPRVEWAGVGDGVGFLPCDNRKNNKNSVGTDAVPR